MYKVYIDGNVIPYYKTTAIEEAKRLAKRTVGQVVEIRRDKLVVRRKELGFIKISL